VSETVSEPQHELLSQFLRKKIIGKNVRVHIDFVRPKEGEFDERECVTVRFGGNQAYALYLSMV
jgi:hypothetical protein